MSSYFRWGAAVAIVTDASPFGMGAVLYQDAEPVQHFSIPITDLDVERMGADRGSCKGQQCWESIAVLVALREWQSWWALKRVTFTYKADNVTA